MKARPQYDVAVIGLGAAGSAILAECARRGMSVVGFEQFDRGHELGSFAGRSRMIRKAYYEHLAYVPLILRAYEGWRQLERATDASLLRVTGLLMIGHSGSEVLSGSVASARNHHLQIEQLDARSVRARFPMFAIADDEAAVYEAGGGYIVPEAAVAASLRVAQSAGATMHFGAAKTADEALEQARQVVLCGGAWMEGLDPGLPLSIERNVQLWFDPAGNGERLQHMPCFLIDRHGFERPLYGFPDDGHGVKAAFHGSGCTTDPSVLDRRISERDVEPVREALRAAIPDAAGAYAGGKACMYELTPDRHFVISRHPTDSRRVIAGGFSGHGFKFAPVVGEAVADLLEDKEPRFDLSLFSAARF